MKRIQIVCGLIALIGILNFLSFVGIAVLIGGDAWNGKIEDGHYYLANHGQYTEVNKPLFTYSQIHAASVLVTHPLMLIAGFICPKITKERSAEKINEHDT